MAKYVTISLDDDIASRIDKYAKENGFSRSGLIAYCCDQYIKAKTIEPELKLALENLASSMESLSKKVESFKTQN